MFADLRQEQTGRRIEADLCIVGAGAAGITIARAFAGTKTRVCLVESGGFEFEAPVQHLYEGSSVGHFVAPEVGRLRFFGGSTNHWTGRCAEFSAAETAARSWVPDSGWPVARDELRPFYQRAWEVCGFPAHRDADDGVLRALGNEAAAKLPAALVPQIWRFAPHQGGVYWNFGTEYRRDLQNAANIQVLLHANLTRFRTSPDTNHVTGIEVRSQSGMSCEIAAKHFVLSCGGIENARLLLQESDFAPRGLGNRRDRVGRYFMQHSRGDAAQLHTFGRLSPVQDIYNDFHGADGIHYAVGVKLAEQAQRERELLNCSAIFVYDGDPDAGPTAAQNIWRNLRGGRWPAEVGEDVWRVVRDIDVVGRNAERRLIQGRHPLLPLRAVTLTVDIEQVPDQDSRITLGSRRDALGLREPVIDWRVSEQERRTVEYFMTALGADMARRDIGRLRLAPWVEAANASWQDGIIETFHHIGATRMSTDPARGVVDANCRVHDIDNLFVAGSSVFPTGGHVNPTLTITALALRLSDHLRETLS